MQRFWPKSLYRWTLAALAETAVAVPWLVLVYRLSDVPDWPAALPGAWLMLLTYGLAAGWELGSPESARRSGQGRLGAMAAGLLVIYLVTFYTTPVRLAPGSPFSLNIALSVLPAAGYLWYQGAASAAEGVEYGRVFTRFGRQSLATVSAVILLVYGGVAADPRVQVLLYWSLFLLFSSGLTLLVITRERSLRQDQARLGETGTGGERMSGLLTGVVIGLVAMTLLASYLLSAERMSAFFDLLRSTVGRPFAWAVDAAMLIVVRWAMIFAWVLQWLQGMVRRQGNPLEAPPMENTEITNEPLPQQSEPVPPGLDWVPYLKVGLMVLGAVILALQLLRLRQRKADADGDPDEQRVDLGLWQGLRADLKAWLGSLRKPENDPAGASVGAGEPADPRDPRALFLRLQLWGASIGRPRGLTETPARYGASLAVRRPEAAGVTAAVTDLYQQARYGAAPPAPEAVRAAADALESLEK